MENIPSQCFALVAHAAKETPVHELRPIKQLSDNEVLVKIEATGIGHLENYLISGESFFVAFPFVPGGDGVGRVVKSGKDGQYLLGKKVVVCGVSGCWSEYVVSTHDWTVVIGDDIPLQLAAFGFQNPFTCLGLLSSAKREGRKSIVVDAASSILGRMINKLARSWNLPVLNVVRRADQEKVLRDEGAEHVIVTEGDWKQKYQALAKQLQSDCLIDSLGTGPVLDVLFRGLIPGGLIIIVGHLQGSSPIVKLGTDDRVQVDKYTFQAWSSYVWLKKMTTEQRQQIQKEYHLRLRSQLATKVANKYHFKDIKQALEASRKNQTEGKIMLIP